MRILHGLMMLFAAAALGAAEFDFDALPDKPFSVVPHYTDRAFWEAQRDTEFGRMIIARADKLLNKEVKLPPDEYYLDNTRKSGPYAGSRARYTPPYEALGRGFSNLAIAYALTADAKYLPKLEEYITANCDGLRTWVHPAHDLKLTNFNRTLCSIELLSATRGGIIAQLALVLKGALSPEAEAKIRRELHRQIIEPYDQAANHGKTRETAYWRKGLNNWNAVCHNGVQLVLLASDMDPVLRKQLLIDSIICQQRYLQGFLADGYTSEGVGYWIYGFKHYLLSAAALRLATDGKIDLLASPQARNAAKFPERIALSPALYPSISDCSPGGHMDLNVMRLRAWLLDEPCTYKVGDPDVKPSTASSVIALIGMRIPKDLPTAPRPPLPRFTEFPDGGVYIMRPQPGNRVAAIFKGGSNHEFHNHNDSGEFIVAVDDVVLAIDPGCTVYTRDTFNSERRYLNRIINSYCHNVPRIDDELQINGKNTAVKVVKKTSSPEKFSIVFDLRRPYRNIDGIKKLTRHLTYDWSKLGEITVTDAFVFAEPKTFETAINTFGSWRKTGANTLEIGDQGKVMKVVIDTQGRPFTVGETRVTDNIRCKKEVTRIAIKLDKPLKSGRVTLTMSAQ